MTKAVLLQLKGIKLRLQFEPDNFRFAGPVMRGGSIADGVPALIMPFARSGCGRQA